MYFRNRVYLIVLRLNVDITSIQTNFVDQQLETILS